ncbi:hypothetical protein [Plebeiibacterium sediminum]|uniref:Peptidoglycan L-alanyl-D-glutamate endopeptidase CwlK n=1 Tax=Plebeiibacterium sediminum TaxID=2992112 RepID=A0AAE3M0L3_9BACT|nr:hypothetical protein [Plebeiobacterium sediminum]MCW3784946.1 hypothetical protein [Plebeiobacterium sediminum]
MPQFGTTSQSRLSTCHHDLQVIMEEAVKYCNVDFGIAEGHRSLKLQQQYYREGKSKINGVSQKGKHNLIPSMAADIYLWINNKASWNAETLTYVAGFIEATARQLYRNGVIKHLIRWGGNWDKDGEILSDQTFDDRPHFELYLP